MAGIGDAVNMAAENLERQGIRVRINGEMRWIDPTVSVADLLNDFGLKVHSVVLELNRNILRKEDWDSTRLSEGDALEIVHFVGGGG